MNTKVIRFSRDKARAPFCGRAVEGPSSSEQSDGSSIENMVQTKFDFDSLPDDEDTDNA